MLNKIKPAPGSPGIEPRWTSSAKSGIGTSITAKSRVWFTISHGIINEIYYPKIDRACIRDFGFLVSDGKNYFSEEKRDTLGKINFLKNGIPAYILNNISVDGRYEIEKRIITDPDRDSVLQHIKFIAGKNDLNDYHIFALLAPHIGNMGFGNTAWLDEYKGVPMLFAKRGSQALALGCSAGWVKRSVGYVGFSDGWQDIFKNKVMEWEYDIAEDGNVALTGEIDLKSCSGEFTIAVGFGLDKEAAGFNVISSLQNNFDEVLKRYISGWKDWIRNFKNNKKFSGQVSYFSSVVIKMQEDKLFTGGIIASLSIPWGSVKGDNDLGGYHLVWTRDLVECAGGLLAIGANENVINILNYLRTTQEMDGRWPQNMWLDGGSYWNGVQMDEVAFPILLLEQAYRFNLIKRKDLKFYYSLLVKAVSYIIKNGPVTQQDRWEEDSGYSPFTLAVEISALVSAGYLLEKLNDKVSAEYLYELSDYWNSCIEKWCYVEGTDIAKKGGVEGYYVRIAPEETSDSASPISGFVAIKNRPPGESTSLASNIISVDALALVRFGLRDANDPRMKNTIKIIDKFLKVETPYGPSWHRYNGDGYGEHEDGTEFDGTGIGRAWPLLTGERAHYELAAGHFDKAESLLKTLESFANETGLIPEQVWDSYDLPEKNLFRGKPTGGAMPLSWAHAEHLKLQRSIYDRHVFDLPEETFKRYVKTKKINKYCCWRLNNKFKSMEKGKILRIELPSKAMIRWTTDNGNNIIENGTSETVFDMHYIDIPTNKLTQGDEIQFNIYWKNIERLDDNKYHILIEV
jgi:glucoamylase